MSERAIEAAAREIAAKFISAGDTITCWDELGSFKKEWFHNVARAALAAAERVGEYRADYEPLTPAEIGAPIPEMDALLKNSKPAAERVAGEDQGAIAELIGSLELVLVGGTGIWHRLDEKGIASQGETYPLWDQVALVSKFEGMEARTKLYAAQAALALSR